MVGERGERVQRLAVEPQRLAAGDDEAHLGGELHPRAHGARRGVHHLLEVVQHHQGGPQAAQRSPGLGDGVAGRVQRHVDRQRVRHGLAHVFRRARLGEVDEPGAAALRPPLALAPGQLAHQPRLAHAAEAHHGEQARALVERLVEGAQIALAPHERAAGRQQVGAARPLLEELGDRGEEHVFLRQRRALAIGPGGAIHLGRLGGAPSPWWAPGAAPPCVAVGSGKSALSGERHPVRGVRARSSRRGTPRSASAAAAQSGKRASRSASSMRSTMSSTPWGRSGTSERGAGTRCSRIARSASASDGLRKRRCPVSSSQATMPRANWSDRPSSSCASSCSGER